MNAATRGGAVLLSEMTPEPSWEAQFNAWYDTEHIPLRMGVPGFRSAQRYRIPGDRHYLAVYEMDSPAVLHTPAYEAIRTSASERTRWILAAVNDFTRYIASQIADAERPGIDRDALDAPVLYTVFFQVPGDRQREFEDWYAREHVPMLLDCPDWLLVRRFRIIGGEPDRWTHLALHYLADRRALDSPERERARAAPWRAKLAQESWFRPTVRVFDRFGPRQRTLQAGTSVPASR